MNEYSWRINQLDCTPAVGSLVNYISTIHWSFIASRQSKQGIINGTVSYPESPKELDFIPFEKITKEEVISWLESSLDMEALKDAADNELNSKIKEVNVFNNPFD
jgi:hypothetical protein